MAKPRTPTHILLYIHLIYNDVSKITKKYVYLCFWFTCAKFPGTLSAVLRILLGFFSDHNFNYFHLNLLKKRLKNLKIYIFFRLEKVKLTI